MKADNRGRGRPPRFLSDDLVQIVRDTGSDGAWCSLVCEKAGATKRSEKVSVAEAMRFAALQGHLAWVADPGPRAARRRRYFAAEFAPSVTGEATQRDTRKARAARRCLPDMEPGPAMTGPVQYAEGYQHTVKLMPAFDHRYQANPAQPIVGGFRSAGPGIDALTGRPWA